MKLKLNLLKFAATIAFAAFLPLVWLSCSKSSSNSSNPSSSAVALSIQTGAQSIAPNGNVSYNAVLVDSKGNTSPATGVSWSVSGSGGSSIGSFSGNVLTGTGIGYGTVTASVQANGKTLTASVPVGVYGLSLFSVVPSAVIWSTNAGSIALTPYYIGTGSTTYTYSSSDATVASVDASGNITFNKAGECAITVTASGLSGSPSVVVPVLVVGTPTVSLPVVRVAVTPNAPEMFRGDNTNLTAKAYDGGGNVVSNSTFSWSSQDASVATVDQTGKVTAMKLGKTIITATASGISGQAEVAVLPDTAVIVTPIMATVAAGGTQQFTDTVYTVNHTTRALTAIPGYSGITWAIPSYGVPVIDSLFNVGTVSSTGLVSVKSSATPGMVSFVLATPSSPSIAPGVGMIMVAVASSCDCGSLTAGVTTITGLPTSTVNLSLTGTSTYNIVAQTNISGAPLHYCSNSSTVCTVDASSGVVTAVGPGNAVITVCNGTVQATFNVSVTF